MVYFCVLRSHFYIFYCDGNGFVLTVTLEFQEFICGLLVGGIGAESVNGIGWKDNQSAVFEYISCLVDGCFGFGGEVGNGWGHGGYYIEASKVCKVCEANHSGLVKLLLTSS